MLAHAGRKHYPVGRVILYNNETPLHPRLWNGRLAGPGFGYTMNLVTKVSIAALLAVLMAFTAPAQNAITTIPVSARVPAAMPFAPGEELTYEGKIRKWLPTIAIADMTFTVSQPGSAGDLIVRAEARSKGTLLKMFRFSFLQEIESTFGAGDARVKSTRKHDVQKDRIRDSEAVFDYKDSRVTYVETDPKEPMRPPRKIASEIGGDTYDMVSAIYRVRSLPLAVGSTFRLSVSDSGLVYDVPVKVTAREMQRTVLGKVMCFRIEPQVFGPGRLIEREGSMIIWMTDDRRRVPVRSQVNSPIGRIEIKLQAARNLKS